MSSESAVNYAGPSISAAVWISWSSDDSESLDDSSESAIYALDLYGGLALADLIEWSPYAFWTAWSSLWSLTELSSHTSTVSSLCGYAFVLYTPDFALIVPIRAATTKNFIIF